MEAKERQSIENLLSDFGWYADRMEAQPLGKLFIPMGRLVMAGVELNSAAAIVAHLSKRFEGSQRITRHLWSNLRITSHSSEAISATIRQVTYEKSATDQPAVARVSDVRDRYGKDQDGNWLFAERIITRVMIIGSLAPSSQ